jgi:ComF family protein
VRQAIHQIKYDYRWAGVRLMGGWLAAVYREAGWDAALFTAVPLHAERLQERGFNQSALLADDCAQRLGLPFKADALKRVRATPSQVGLDYDARQANVSGAFVAVPALVHAQRIVLVDDVYTSGATIRACASALLEAGAACVWGLTVASAATTP